MGSSHLWTLVFLYLTTVLGNATKRVTLERPKENLHPGDSVTIRCVGSEMENVDLYRTGKLVEEDSGHQIIRTDSSVELRIGSMSGVDVGLYSCVSNGAKVTGESSVGLYSWSRGVRLRTSSDLLPDQGNVTLTCSVLGFKNCQWFRRKTASDPHLETLNESSSGWAKSTVENDFMDSASIIVSRGGVYSARGVDWLVLTEESNRVTVWETVSRSVSLAAESNIITNQGTVKLSCDTHGLQKYEWIRRFSLHNSTSQILKEDTPTITVSGGGVYSCRGKEGFILTPESDHVVVWEHVSNRAVLQPDSAGTELLSGQTLSLRCEVEAEGGSDSDWSYEWRKNKVLLPTVTREYRLSNVSTSDSGDYSCRGTRGDFQTTQWSEETRIQVLNKVVPVLSVFPLWLSLGASVSLKCDVTAALAGLRFYWYRTVPLSSGLYSYVLLPGLSSGTALGSYTVLSLSSTAGFVCRAAQGTPEVYTEYSPPQFVWTADAGSRVSPTVNPNSSQHFIFDPVSVSCGSSDEDWRVQMFSLTTLSLLQCPSHTTEDKHKCDVDTDQKFRAVFWCESGSGEMTDAVNITIHDSVILLTPTHPVPEGQSVSLTCKLARIDSVSWVRFYKDGLLIQEGSSRKYILSAPSKSDEGLYKCSQLLTSQRVLTSAESWLSVRVEEKRPSVVLLVLVGVICLILLLILLLILWRYRKTKDLCSMRSKKKHQTFAEYDMTAISPSEELTYTELEFKERSKPQKEQDAIYSNVVSQSAADVDVVYSQVHHYKKQKTAVKHETKSPDDSANDTVYSEVRKTKGPKD